jgi:general secretion pathway protein B
MSFILDALKKSEAERQRQNVPGMLDLPTPSPKPRFPMWGIWLGLLLGVNLIVLLVVLIRSSGSGTASAPAVAAAPTQAAAQAMPAASAPVVAAAAAPAAGTATAAPPAVAAANAAAPAADGAFSPMEGQPVYAPEIPVTDPPRGATPAGAYPSAGGQPALASTAGPLMRQPLPPQAQIPPDPNEIVPTLQEVNLSGNRGIPELHLDIHVFAAKPAERFVFINNRKYREGATLQEGPTVERITRDGVILNYQNLRFSIPRM